MRRGAIKILQGAVVMMLVETTCDSFVRRVSCDRVSCDRPQCLHS
jgi:hypothetical protein